MASKNWDVVSISLPAPAWRFAPQIRAALAHLPVAIHLQESPDALRFFGSGRGCGPHMAEIERVTRATIRRMASAPNVALPDRTERLF